MMEGLTLTAGILALIGIGGLGFICGYVAGYDEADRIVRREWDKTVGTWLTELEADQQMHEDRVSRALAGNDCDHNVPQGY